MASSLPATDGYRRTGITDLLSLKGHTVVVTGGARGLGLSFAWAVGEVGANVAIFDLLDEPHDDFDLLEKELGIKAKFYQYADQLDKRKQPPRLRSSSPWTRSDSGSSVDVTNYESLERAFAKAKDDFGSIDHCITSAGISRDKPFLEHTPADVAALLAVNVGGSFHAAQLAAKHMKEQGRGGSIVMISSIAAHGAVPGRNASGYSFTKGAILSGCKTLADELVGDNIRVNTISPGYILTDMTVAHIARRPNILEDTPQNVPMRRIGDRRDLKGAIVLLLSEASAYTTGSDLLIDGGVIAH